MPPAARSPQRFPASTQSCRTGSTSTDSRAEPPGRRRCTADAPAVLFVGRLEPRKGVERLIRAMAIVQQRAPDARLVIVGDGPDRAALEAAARGARVDRRVRRPCRRRGAARLLSGRRPRLLARAGRRELRHRAARGDGGRPAGRRDANRRLRGAADRLGMRAAGGARRRRAALAAAIARLLGDAGGPAHARLPTAPRSPASSTGR